MDRRPPLRRGPAAGVRITHHSHHRVKVDKIAKRMHSLGGPLRPMGPRSKALRCFRELLVVYEPQKRTKTPTRTQTAFNGDTQ